MSQHLGEDYVPPVPTFGPDHLWLQHGCPDCAGCTYFACTVHDVCRCLTLGVSSLHPRYASLEYRQRGGEHG